MGRDPIFIALSRLLGRWVTMAAVLFLAACCTPVSGDRAVGIAAPASSEPQSSAAMNMLLAAGLVSDPGSSAVRDLPCSHMPQSAEGRGTSWVDVGWAAITCCSPRQG